MKRITAFILCFVIISMLVITATFADESKPLDIRDLEEYGQQHFYLGAPVSKETAPNVSDAVVNENEYVVSYEYKYGDKCAVFEKGATGSYFDNEWVRVHLSYNNDKLFVAMETKDPNYVAGKDGFGINLGFRNGGRTLDAISRYCFDLYAHEDAVPEDNTTLKTKCRKFVKKDNGEWDNPPNVDGMVYIDSISVSHNDKSDITTIEAEFDIQYLIKEWNNDLPLEDIRMYLFTFIYMHGPSSKGANDAASQGLLWGYLPSKNIESLKPQLTVESSYWPSIIPHVVHFCEDPQFTTTAPTTTEATTVAMITDAVATTTSDAPFTTVNTVGNEGGCASSVSLLSVAFVPMISAVLFVGKRKEDIE